MSAKQKSKLRAVWGVPHGPLLTSWGWWAEVVYRAQIVAMTNRSYKTRGAALRAGRKFLRFDEEEG